MNGSLVISDAPCVFSDTGRASGRCGTVFGVVVLGVEWKGFIYHRDLARFVCMVFLALVGLVDLFVCLLHLIPLMKRSCASSSNAVSSVVPASLSDRSHKTLSAVNAEWNSPPSSWFDLSLYILSSVRDANYSLLSHENVTGRSRFSTLPQYSKMPRSITLFLNHKAQV